MPSTPLITALGVLAMLLLLSVPAEPLMPPQICSTEPPDQGVLQDNTYVLHGYTLDGLDTADIQVLDSQGNSIFFVMIRECSGEGVGCAPGMRQSRCTITLALDALVPGAAYTVHVLGETWTFHTAR